MGEMLRINATLMTLNLSANYIDDGGAMSIADALYLNNTLTSFDARLNIGLCTQGQKALHEARATKNGRLTLLL